MNRELALRANVLPSPQDLDGWETDDVLAGLSTIAGSFREFRLATGLLQWKLRTLVPDAVYGDHAAKIAQRCDVDVRTLRTWRANAEEHWKLRAPDIRTERAREVQKAKAPVSTGTPDVSSAPVERPTPATDEKIRPTEVIPPSEPAAAKPTPTRSSRQLEFSFDAAVAHATIPTAPPQSPKDAAEGRRIAREWDAWSARLEAGTPTPRSTVETHFKKQRAKSA